MRLPDLVDLYLDDRVQVWVRLLPEGMNLSVEEVGTRSVGSPPAWWTEDVQRLGLEDILQTSTWDFLLENGIAPGQPFLLEMPTPYYGKYWTDYGYEYDTDYDWNVIRILPWKPKRVLQLWEKAMRYYREDREAVEQAKLLREEEARKKKELREADIDAMYVSYETFCNGKCCPDCCCGCHSPRYHLVSKHDEHRGTWGMAYGEDRGGKDEIAFENLIRDAAKKLPHIPEERIRKMERRSHRWGW